MTQTEPSSFSSSTANAAQPPSKGESSQQPVRSVWSDGSSGAKTPSASLNPSMSLDGNTCTGTECAGLSDPEEGNVLFGEAKPMAPEPRYTVAGLAKYNMWREKNGMALRKLFTPLKEAQVDSKSCEF
eukprot:1158095-Pelagomonas_calceolata.AAC.5